MRNRGLSISPTSFDREDADVPETSEKVLYPGNPVSKFLLSPNVRVKEIGKY